MTGLISRVVFQGAVMTLLISRLVLQGAVMSGLISRVIFIWPSWDHASHSHVYESSHVGVGWYIPDSKEVDKPKELCFCNVST